MSASKTLMAAIAAATIVGTVGFVSAQTTDPAAPSGATATQPMTNPSAASPMPAQPAAPGSTTAPAMSDTAPPADTLEPKADRN